MKKQKKEPAPIAGQNRPEKSLDFLTRQEHFKGLMIEFLGGMLLQAFGIFFAANILERPELAERLLRFWKWNVLPLTAVPMLDALSGFWDLRGAARLRGPITEQVGRCGSCTYQELVTACMPLKIHLGLDAAIEEMLKTQQLLLDCDAFGIQHYRLPT